MENKSIVPTRCFTKTADIKDAMVFESKSRVNEYLSDFFEQYKYCLDFVYLSSQGILTLSGICYDFRAFLKRILVKQYGQWCEYYAPNKTKLKRALDGPIEEMVYIDK